MGCAYYTGEIIGMPIPKGRPRMSTRGGFARTYTPKRTRDEEDRIRTALLAWTKEKAVEFDGDTPVRVTVAFGMPIPKSRERTTGEGDQHLIRPDLDNFLKCFLDAANGVLFMDDSQVWSVEAKKVYSTVPKIAFTVEYLYL